MGDAGHEFVVDGGAHQVGVAADGLPKAGDGVGEVGRGAFVVGEDAGGSFKKGGVGGRNATFLRSGHRVAANELQRVIFDQRAERQVGGGFHAADIGDEAAGRQSGCNGIGEQAWHGPDGDGEHDQARSLTGGGEGGGGAGDAELGRGLE